MDRLEWNLYFMEIAKVVATRATCCRRKVGAIIVKDRQIISTGYNGAPKGVKHCEESGCLRKKMKIPSGERYEMCRASHAEMNAIIQAAFHGISTKDSELFCTCMPCQICAKMIINAGIKVVYWLGDDYFPGSPSLFQEAGVLAYNIR